MEYLVNGKWHASELSPMHPGDRHGSMSDRSTGTREVISFGLIAGKAVVRKAKPGTDSEFGVLRFIEPTGWEPLADLGPGEEFVREIQTDRMNKPIQVRWRCEE